jgi:hypothetical protein
MTPMTIPPRIPKVMMGIHDLVMMAHGTLSKAPKIRPFNQPATGRDELQMTNAIANRSAKAPTIAVFRSSIFRGIIVATEKAPNAAPLMIPVRIADIDNSPVDYDGLGGQPEVRHILC